MKLTKLFEHFVALVQDEVLDFRGVEDLVPHESVQSAGGRHHDVRALGLVAEEFGILGHGSAAVESADTDVGHVLREASVLVLDLERKLAGVAKYDDRYFAVDRFELLESCQNKDSRLSVPGFRLAQHVHSQDGLRNTLLLD